MADETAGNEQSAGTIDTPATTPPDDFIAALNEFEEANGKADKPTARDPRQQIQETREQLDAVRQLGELRLWAHDVESERIERREREDTETVFAKAKQLLADYPHLPGDFVERWLRAEYQLDAELHHAWNNRYESDDAKRQAQNSVRRAMDRLLDATKKVPDPETQEVIATRSAISAFMLRGSRPPPPSGPPNYSAMTDKEFSEAVKKEHGYTPL